jgi:uncharacterized repeat protein (TIGR03803 family)
MKGRQIGIVIAFAWAVGTAAGQTFTTLVNFAGPNGKQPDYGTLVQGIDGNFYGTTALGGASSYGTVFLMTPDGGLKLLHSFNQADGGRPNAGLIQTVSGLLYGTTRIGGANGRGTIFQVTPGGTLTTLSSFDVSNGAKPFAGLVQAFDGQLYGTTDGGGGWGYGTVFTMDLMVP